jgi:hypothetical protein
LGGGTEVWVSSAGVGFVDGGSAVAIDPGDPVDSEPMEIGELTALPQ